MLADVVFDKLENMPSLREGWVRLIHRCVADQRVANIKENGLIFNKKAAGLPWQTKGGSCYDGPSSMATAHNAESFWLTMQKDDMGCFDDNRTAGAKVIFDMPLEEYLFLEVCGEKVKGKIDSKYIVGCVQNINSWNKNLSLSAEEVKKAEKISQNNPPSTAEPNNLESMINEYVSLFSPEKSAFIKDKIRERMRREKDDFLYTLNEEIRMQKLENKTGLTPVEIRKLPLQKRKNLLAQIDFENGIKIDKEDLKVAKARIKQHLEQNKKDEPKKSAEAEKIAPNLSLLKSAEKRKTSEK